MADLRTILLVTLWLVWWPCSRLINAVVVIVSPFWRAITFVLLPFIHLGDTIVTIITSPFGVRWLDRIETIYIFLGTAALVGGITGVVMFLTFKFLSSTLNIDTTIVPSRDQGRTTAQFRSARREKKDALQSPSGSPVVLKKVTGPSRRGLLSQAIIEEEDSDF